MKRLHDTICKKTIQGVTASIFIKILKMHGHNFFSYAFQVKMLTKFLNTVNI